MREHIGLFRGKRIDTGEWIEGFYSEYADPQTGEQHSFINTIRSDGRFAASHIVDPDTIGECTGPKDKNGKLIFEGEAIKYKDRIFGEVTAVVEYSTEGACFCAHTLGSINSPALDIVMNESEIELLGALCDNPELLEGGEGE